MEFNRKDNTKYRKRLISQLTSPFPKRQKAALRKLVELDELEKLWQMVLKKLEAAEKNNEHPQS